MRDKEIKELQCHNAKADKVYLQFCPCKSVLPEKTDSNRSKSLSAQFFVCYNFIVCYNDIANT